jgi:hypothetical protein
LFTWRKARLDLANFEFATEGTDGCIAGYEFTPEQQKKFCRDVALRLVEGEEAEQLKAEMEADEVEERAAGAAMGAGEDLLLRLRLPPAMPRSQTTTASLHQRTPPTPPTLHLRVPEHHETHRHRSTTATNASVPALSPMPSP